MKPATKERLFLWGAAPLLAAVLVLLAVLQYHWSGEVSAATRSQMQSNLRTALIEFRQDLARELAATGTEVRSEIGDPNHIDPADWSQQFKAWQSATAHPTLVSHIYLWQNSGDAKLLTLNTARAQTETAEWPEAFSRLHQRLQEISPPIDRAAVDNGPRRHHVHSSAGGTPGGHLMSGLGRPKGASRGHARDPFAVWWVDQSIPALVYPMRTRTGPDEAPRPPTVSWIIIQLDGNTLTKEIFPELAQKYFTRNGRLDYQVAVLENAGGNGNTAPGVMYSSGSGFGENSGLPGDGSLNLFGPLTHRSGTPVAGVEMFAITMPRPSANDHATPGQADNRAQGMERSIRLEPLTYAGAPTSWELVVKHQDGSLEAVVTRLRWHTLSVSFGALVLLAGTMAMVLIASQRARRLAMLQMDFVAGVSHELRTPLAVISSAAENIAHGVVADKQQMVRYGDSILKQTRQLTQLVEQVLVFSATQQKAQRYQLRALDVAEVIEAALENTASVIAGGGVSVERRVEPGLPAVAADFAALSQCLQNLITNAVKYGGESRWVGIRAAAYQENNSVREVTVTIEDKGIGIDPGEIKQIFDPFYRSPAVAESNIHGTGLGLPLAKTLIEAMRGRLTVESELGKGTSFTVHLPVAEGPYAVGVQTALDNETSAAPG
ncbi:MAG TPA: HAMP domain-containing sensor histidine kinase [Candidatus Angelobacter sp.]|nr:HAMP domain-containing sensor histidine kinase [Candidatus Angelobacter sp.]